MFSLPSRTAKVCSTRTPSWYRRTRSSSVKPGLPTSSPIEFSTSGHATGRIASTGRENALKFRASRSISSTARCARGVTRRVSSAPRAQISSTAICKKLICTPNARYSAAPVPEKVPWLSTPKLKRIVANSGTTKAAYRPPLRSSSSARNISMPPVLPAHTPPVTPRRQTCGCSLLSAHHCRGTLSEFCGSPRTGSSSAERPSTMAASRILSTARFTSERSASVKAPRCSPPRALAPR
mmetsp:Transcript_9721/g.28182  ORF Transcript_9721/g.28182 Transcript_9721/m.28182 type:complete len:238 (+) Transcript_9721:350-1063(+)